MNKLAVQAFLSLDGYGAGPNGEFLAPHLFAGNGEPLVGLCGRTGGPLDVDSGHQSGLDQQSFQCPRPRREM